MLLLNILTGSFWAMVAAWALWYAVALVLAVAAGTPGFVMACAPVLLPFGLSPGLCA